MTLERSLPIQSANMPADELELYLETIPLAVRETWHVTAAQADVLLGDLRDDPPVPLTAAQHALMTIAFAMTPRPLMYGRELGPVLHHPRTAPGGARSAVSAMCDDDREIEQVATYFHELPHGPLLLPGVLMDLVASDTFGPEAVADMVAEAHQLRDDTVRPGHQPQDRAAASSLLEHLEAEVRGAPDPVRRALLAAMIDGVDPAVATWAAQQMA